MNFVGDDWAEAHHDLDVCNEAGDKLAARRLPEGIGGIAILHELVAAHAADPADVVVEIETDRGLWVQALVEVGYVVFAVNPRAASRYRDRHTLSGAKSDPGDAKMLSALVRTDTTIVKSQATPLCRGRQGRGPGASDVDLGTNAGYAPVAVLAARVFSRDARNVR